MKPIDQKGVYRIIDANLNRSKEGLRVCEEIARFLLCDPGLCAGFKNIRHGIDSLAQKLGKRSELLCHRDAENDPGKRILAKEMRRNGVRDILYANIQRVKESVRVLEEFSKLKSPGIALGFKRIRYRAYSLEKKIIKLI